MATIINTPKLSFFTRMKLDFEKLWKHIPQDEATALTTVNYLAPLVLTVIACADAPLLPVIAPIITEVQQALTAVAVVLRAGGPQTTVASFLDSIKANLASLLQAGEVKNSASAAKITGIVTEVITEVESLIAVFTPAPVTLPAPAVTTTTASPTPVAA